MGPLKTVIIRGETRQDLENIETDMLTVGVAGFEPTTSSSRTKRAT